MGKLIVIEGLDGSGKATQSKLLFDFLNKNGENVKKIEFPDYESSSSSLIKMYLAGDFGKNADDVNPFVASTFYTVDRFASFKKKWQAFYEDGGIIVADRYTTSNMIHQASKIENEKDKNSYLEWLINFEYEIFKLPKPDIVIFLNMPPKISQSLMLDRANKFTGGKEKDIHEKNLDYLQSCYKNALYVAKKFNWKIIDCFENDKILSIEEIHKKIVNNI